MAKHTARPSTTEQLIPLTPDTEELTFMAEVGLVLVEFLKAPAVVAFFTQARTLETKALARLSQAKALKAPTSAGEDETIQVFIKSANAEKKTVMEHWTIASKVHQLHKRLVARRSKSETALEEAANLAQTLHNRYVEEARRKAAQEQDRLRREAELRAQADRQRELDELEAAAVKAEGASEDLSEREQAFVQAFYSTGNGLASAQRAGFKDPAKAASRLLSATKIQRALAGLQAAAAARQQAAAVQEQPLDVQVETVTADVVKASGAVDRTTYKMEITDPVALREAAFAGTYGIPHDMLAADPVKGNEYARSMREIINRWPGCRLVKSTKTV